MAGDVRNFSAADIFRTGGAFDEPIAHSGLSQGRRHSLRFPGNYWIKVESLNPFDLGRNHQVLAYGYDLDETSGDLQIHVYDPNCPNDDSVTLAVNVADPDNPSRITYSADTNGRGFFRSRYNAADPSAALLTA